MGRESRRRALSQSRRRRLLAHKPWRGDEEEEMTSLFNPPGMSDRLRIVSMHNQDCTISNESKS